MADGKGDSLSTGRFKRLGKMASLSAKLSTDVGARLMKRFVRTDGEDLSVSLLGPEAAEKLVATLGDLKGLAMKVGQGLSMDPDLLTPEIRAVVARLQNQAPPMPFETVRQVITDELGQPPEALYASFETAPLASASLGQVHKAVTRGGETVAVKVQYPGIAKAIEADLENVGAMVRVMAAAPRMGHTKEYFREVQQGLLEELDYEVEAERARRFEQATKLFPDLRVPRVFDSLTAARVLTLEYFGGTTMKEFLATVDSRSGAERFHLSRLLIRAIWGPLLTSGLIHGDPHPGNFMLMPDGSLGVLDFGAIKQVSDRWMHANRRLMHSFYGGAPYEVIGESERAGMEFTNRDEARPFVEGVLQLACRSVQTEAFNYDGAGLNRELRTLFMRHALLLKRIKPPAEALHFFRAVAGANQNLENLKAQGPFRAVFRELHDIAQRHGKS
jgi:predicted unusual protein kinase regulating ubiquinone biosynthesis (AarF/ABC1/UbiB family)